MGQARANPEMLPYWEHLEPAERRLVQSNAYIRSYKKGAYIFRPGMDDCPGMLMLISGELRAHILSRDGREVTLFRLHDGDVCVFTAACFIRQITFDTFMTAETACVAMVIGYSAFSQLTSENVYVRCFMFELIAERFSAVMRTMQQILFDGFDRRLAGFLVSEHDRLGTVELRMTHEQIAKYLGSAREVVARMLKRFALDGLVEAGRGHIRLTDLQGLRRLAADAAETDNNESNQERR